MPRIIDVDTEAFAPTYQKAYKEREPLGDVSRRRMAADLQLLGQAMPYVSEGIKGIDQYVVTPIQQAMKESREEEYKAKKAGETPFEIGETTMQKIARERLRPKESLEAQKPSYISGEEAAKMFGEERPEFGELEVPVGEAKMPDVSTTALIEKQREEQLAAQRLKEQAKAKLAALPEEAARRAAAESRYMPSLMPIRPTTEADRQRFAANVAEALKARPQAAAPTEPAPTRMMPEHPVPTGYQWPARGRYTAPGAPTEGFAGAEAPAEPTQTAQMAKTATTTARAGARTAAEPVAPTEPAKPKTLATVTDDELSDVKRRLEKMVEQNPEDKELADRLEMVNLEQRHRGEKMEYEDWAAMARAADTVEEQRKVLEMAKRARMPVEGLESLLTSPFERAKLKALGAKGEKGLFPEVARPLTSWEIDKKETEIRINQLKAQGLSDKQAADQALAEKRRAEAGRARAQTTEIETMLEPKYAAAAEKPFLMHAQEEKAKAETQKILELLPGQKQKLADESAKLKALAAKARGSIRRGGAGLNSDELKWVKEINDRRNEMVNQATKVEMEAEAQYGRLEVAAERAKLMAERAALDANKLGPVGFDEAENRKIRQAQAEASAAKTAYEQAEADRRVANKARIDAQANKREALRAGDVDKADADYLTELAMKKRGITLPSAQKRAGAAPVAPAAKEEGGIISAVRGMFGGSSKPAAAPAKKGSKIDDFFGK